MTRQTKPEDYPPGVQCLLKDAMWHMEQLTLLELEFRAWQVTQGETKATGARVVDSWGREIELFAPPVTPDPAVPVGIGKLVAPSD